MNKNEFDELKLLPEILRAVSEQGYTSPTPIQSQAIPLLLEGRDLLGIAQTGTGKTAAFALPILDFLASEPLERQPRRPSVLVLTPTRELASQVAENFRVYGKHLDVRCTVVFGGVGQRPQVRDLQRGIDVLVATPGRLIDLMDQGHIDFRDIEVFVLDEADRMLDMGFAPAVRKVIANLPSERQTLLFSATMPNDIVKLAHSVLRDPVRVEVTPPATTVDRVHQSVMFVEKADKRKLLVEVLRDKKMERVLVFTRTKHGADRVVKHLRREEESAAAIHGDKAQNARERALEAFRDGAVRVLVATDIAARGIDVSNITHVVNFDLPAEAENYVHRIGRTARAGREGIALSFCGADEREYLRTIQKATRTEIPVVTDHPFRSTTPAGAAGEPPRKRTPRPAPSGRRPGPRQPGGRKTGGRKAGGRKKRGRRPAMAGRD